MRINADNPSNADLLGYDPYVTALTGILAAPDLETPFTVGIYGPWGTGKSTFMNLLANRLRDPHKLDTVLFEPWQFDQKEEIWKALLYTVLQYLQTILDAQASTTEEQRQILENLFKGVSRLVLEKTINYFAGEKVDIEKILGAAAKTDRQNTEFVNTFRATFVDAKNKILGAVKDQNKNNRLIVFVDDLDRCSPDNCLMVLEAIKLFFDLRECVFVLGIDRDIIQKGVQRKYKDSIAIRGQDYLEKIVQLPFTLPPISADIFRNYVASSMDGFGFNQTTLALIENASENNPRRVKRLGNCLALVKSVADGLIASGSMPQVSTFDESKLAVLLMVQVRFPSAYSWLCSARITYREIVGKATIVNPEGDEADSRSEIVAWIKTVDGADDPEITALAFLRFLRFAFTEQKVPDFVDSKELEAYLRITSVASDAPPSPGAPLHDRLDQLLGRTEPTEPNAGDPPPSMPAVQPDDLANATKSMSAQVDQMDDEWRWIQSRGTVSTLVSSTLRRQQRFDAFTSRVDGLRRDFAAIRPNLSYSSAQDIQFKLEPLGRIPKTYVAQQLRSAARALMLFSILGFLIGPYVAEVVVVQLEATELRTAQKPASAPEKPAAQASSSSLTPSSDSEAQTTLESKGARLEPGAYIPAFVFGRIHWSGYLLAAVFLFLFLLGGIRDLEAGRALARARPPRTATASSSDTRI